MTFSCEPEIIKLIGYQSWYSLKQASKVAQSLEDSHQAQWLRIFKEYDDKFFEAFAAGKPMPSIDFGWLLTVQKYKTIKDALELAEKQGEFKQNPRAKLAKLPSGKIPRNLRDLAKWWDSVRKKRVVGKRERALADEIKKKYLEKVQSVWQKTADAFMQGEKKNQIDAKMYFKKELQDTQARANTVVNTETTRYYNAARVAYYNESDDVTHYLFLAIRDKRTTKWCAPYQRGGRHGLVYRKGTRFFENEMCPCHWNCRSEMTPLTQLNPVHLKLINDESRWRENNNPFPLPKGWHSSAAA